jgi:hypothetical protein
MKSILTLPIVRRKLICILLGFGFGFLCAYVGWILTPELKADPNFWWSPLMWAIVYNRTLIGFFVLLFGIFTIHPIFHFKLSPWFRGATAGAVVSLDLAIGSLLFPYENAWQTFWALILVGAIYGLIIDVVATKFAGEGEDLLKKL